MSSPTGPAWDDQEIDHDDDPGLDIDVLRRRREFVLTFLALFLIVIAAIFTGHKLLSSPKINPGDLTAIARQAVREQMPAGHAVHFGGTQGGDEKMEIAERRAGESFELSGRVMAIRPDGLHEFYLFKCWVERAQNSRWRPSKVEITPAAY